MQVFDAYNRAYFESTMPMTTLKKIHSPGNNSARRNMNFRPKR
jgi:hypothetical protein